MPAFLVLLGVIINDRLKEAFVGPKTYKVYMVGNLADLETLRVYRGIDKESRISGLSFDGVPIEIERRDDFANEDIARSVSTELAEKPDTLLVLGHVLSTQTRAALPQYFGAEPPIPVITTVDTLPVIWTPKSGQEKLVPPIFRMSPTDDKQAEAVAAFALGHKRSKFVIVADSWNQAYSSYLVAKFADLLRNGGVREGNMVKFMNGEMPSNDELRKINPDCIFIAGEWSRSLMWVHLVKSVWNKPGEQNHPMIILSDSAVNPQLVRPGDGDVNDTYLSFQLPACKYSEADDVNLYGTDAWQIIRRLIEQGNTAVAAGNLPFWARLRRHLGIHRVSDARTVLSTMMIKDEDESTPFTGSRGDIYQFGREGLNQNGQFHVWEVQTGRFVDVDDSGKHCPHDEKRGAAPLLTNLR